VMSMPLGTATLGLYLTGIPNLFRLFGRVHRPLDRHFIR
jgi:hypothetical protein